MRRRLAVVPHLFRRHHNILLRQHKQTRHLDIFREKNILEPPDMPPNRATDERLRPENRRHVPLALGLMVYETKQTGAEVQHQHCRIEQHHARDTLRRTLDHPAHHVAPIRVAQHGAPLKAALCHRGADARNALVDVRNILCYACRHKRHLDEQQRGPSLQQPVHYRHVRVQPHPHPVEEHDRRPGLIRVTNPVREHGTLNVNPLESLPRHLPPKLEIKHHHREKVRKQKVVPVRHGVQRIGTAPEQLYTGIAGGEGVPPPALFLKHISEHVEFLHILVGELIKRDAPHAPRQPPVTVLPRDLLKLHIEEPPPRKVLG
mmetsp:Transcript_42868/g.83850  ORF Transcript_42868/g.83850 Transcript_42868/m.83850 type:complete len:318 (+) Transcript_42868:178-1131(+)